MCGVEFRPARPDEWPAALECLFGYVAPAHRGVLIAHAAAALRRGEMPSDGFWIGFQAGRVLAAVIASIEPGRVGQLTRPGVATEVAAEHALRLEDGVVAAAVDWLARQGVSLVHALLPDRDPSRDAALARGGFFQPTSLRRYQKGLADRPGIADAEALEFHRYGPANADVFVATLTQTYHETRDIPELDRRRHEGDVLNGYRTCGDSSDWEWWLVTAPSEGPVGVVVVAEVSQAATWELLYLGLIPKARGQRFGRSMVTWVLNQAHAAGMIAVTLSVDTRNEPALRLYESLGFQPCDEWFLWLKFLHDPVPAQMGGVF